MEAAVLEDCHGVAISRQETRFRGQSVRGSLPLNLDTCLVRINLDVNNYNFTPVVMRSALIGQNRAELSVSGTK